MRTTLVISDDLFRQLKMAAAARGMSMKEILREALESELERAKEPAQAYRAKLPVLGSSKPGSLTLTNAQIEDLLA